MAIAKKTEKKATKKELEPTKTAAKKVTKTAKSAVNITIEKETPKVISKTVKESETSKAKPTTIKKQKVEAASTIKKTKKEEILIVGKELKTKKSSKKVEASTKDSEPTNISRRKALADSELLIDTIVKSMQDRKAKDIVSLDLKSIVTRISDHFVICHGTSTTQVSAIADSVEHFVRKTLKIKPWHKEGLENCEWILIDYCDVVVHIFEQDKRGFYDIENLWADAEIMEYDNVE